MSEPIVLRVFFKQNLIAVKQFEQNQIIIGKKGDSSLVLRQKDVADIHCVIEKRGEGYVLCDLGSESGTIIHNERVLEHPLKSGDIFFISELEVHFFIGTPTFTTSQVKTQNTNSEDQNDVYTEDDLQTFDDINPEEKFEPKKIKEQSPFVSLGDRKPEYLKKENLVKKESNKENENENKNNNKVSHKTDKTFKPEEKKSVENKSENKANDRNPSDSTNSIKIQPKDFSSENKKISNNKKPEKTRTSASGFEMMDLSGRPEPKDNLSEGLNRKLGTFAPQSSFEELDEVIDVNSRGSVVEVLLTWKERILSASHFDSKQKVFLGNQPDCQLQLSTLSFKHFFININNGAEIRIPERMDGFLYRGQQRIPFSALKKSGQLSRDGDCYVLNLSQGEMVRCFLLGDRIQAYVRYVEQTPKALPIPVFDFSSSELVSIAMAFFVSIVISIYMTFNVPKSLDDIETLVEDQYRVATVEFKPPPRREPEPPVEIEPKKEEPIVPPKVIKKVTEEKQQIKPIVEKKPTTNVPKQQSLGVKGPPKKVSVVDKDAGKPKEVAPNKIKTPAKGMVSNKAGGAVSTGKEGANAETKKKDVTKSGLLSILSSGGAANTLDKAYSGAGTTFGLADKATGFGGQASDRQGEGLGTDLKNVGAGGKGTATVGIAGVGSKGRGGGEASYGGNNGLGDKGEVAIVNIEGNTNDFVSSIDKEAIRRIIRSNRSAIKSCYDQELTKNQTLSGKIVLQWQIAQGGRMLNAKVKSNDTGSNSLGPCIINRLTVLKFPDPGPDEIAEVAFPFVFEAR